MSFTLKMDHEYSRKEVGGFGGMRRYIAAKGSSANLG